jgi:hypothetical protein
MGMACFYLAYSVTSLPDVPSAGVTRAGAHVGNSAKHGATGMRVWQMVEQHEASP